MSQRQYAEMLGVSYSAVQYWEGANTVPGSKNLMKIADSAGMTLKELLDYLESPEETEIQLPVEKPLELEDVIDAIEHMSYNKAARVAKAAMDRVAIMLAEQSAIYGDEEE